MKLTEAKFRKIISSDIKRVVRNRTLSEADVPPAGGADVMTNFDVSKGPSAAVAFLNGPGADKRVKAILAAGTTDGDAGDEAATISEGGAMIGDLVPTQVEIELTKSIAYPLAKFDAMKKMISGGTQRIGPPGNDMIVTSGNLIVDGHHRWSSLFSVAGPDGVIAAKDISLPEKDAASVLAIVQTAIATTLPGGVPAAKAGGMNILGKGQGEIAEMIRQAYESGGGEVGPILTDEYVLACLNDPKVSAHFGLGGTSPQEEQPKTESRRFRGGLLAEKSSKLGKKMDSRVVTARNTIINKVAENLSQMNQPAEGAPPRVDMPQLDKAGGGVQGALNSLESGKVNYKPPFVAESSTRSGEVLTERWQKLAGLIK
jgi:hypothetical protein